MEEPNAEAQDRGEKLAANTVEQTRIGSLKLPREALRAYTMVLALIAVWVFFQYATGGIFLEARNFSNLMRQTAVTGVLSVGMLMVIVTGQIDLSVGSVVGLAGGVAAAAASQAWLGWGLIPSLAAAVIVGLMIGAAHGLLVAYASVPAFIVTLGGLLVWRGVIKGVSQGNTIPIELQGFKAIGQCYLHPLAGYTIAGVIVGAITWQTIRRSRSRQLYGMASQGSALVAARILAPSIAVLAFTYALNAYTGIPAPVIILLAVALLGTFITQNTTFGRYLYAIGGNPEAARLSGISIRRHLLAVFCIMGALAGVAALIYTARVGSASPDAGVLLELDAIAACVIGGASLMGGRGTVFGACVGALFMASLDNGMSLKNLPDFTQDIIKGAILVGAVGLDMLGRRRG
ncbi:MAG: sugar ABC transporter permease [Blastocatellia bacterium]